VIRVEDALETVSGVDPGPFRGVFDAAVVRGFVVTPYRDGFRTRPIAAITSNTAHLGRVEVLKGPASVLYGHTDPGGLINLVTKKPLTTPYYSLQQQFGSFDLYRTTLDATGPMTDDDTLLYRVNAAYENIGSFRDFLDQEEVFIAPVLTWNLSDRTRVTFDLQYFHGDFPRDRGIVALSDRPAPIPIERSLGEPFCPTTAAWNAPILPRTKTASFTTPHWS
jgi:iron complex outermembrane recepter protein